uniref:Uncharacterized protein n=1 Tax=Oryza punctata TaxID=4537 RepID=A0A0E0MLN8_ORYPU
MEELADVGAVAVDVLTRENQQCIDEEKNQSKDKGEMGVHYVFLDIGDPVHNILSTRAVMQPEVEGLKEHWPASCIGTAFGIGAGEGATWTVLANWVAESFEVA